VDQKAAEVKAKDAATEAATKVATVSTTAAAATAAATQAGTLPRNTAYGENPKQAALNSVLKVKSGASSGNNTAYMKFPLDQLTGSDTIVGAALRVYKQNAGTGPATIKLASCSWDRQTLTYSKAENLAQVVCTESVGTVFADAENLWLSFKLKASMIESARAKGDHVCFEISGGTGDAAPIELASDLSSNKPELKLEVQKKPPTAAEIAAAKAKADKDATSAVAQNKQEAIFADAAKKKFTDELMAAKGAALTTAIAKAKTDSAVALDQAITGAALVLIKQTAENSAQAAAARDILAQTEVITNQANADKEKSVVDSGLSGSKRDDFVVKAEAARAATVKTKVEAMQREANAKATATATQGAEQAVATAKTAIEDALKVNLAKLAADSSTLSESDKNQIASKVQASVAASIALWIQSKPSSEEELGSALDNANNFKPSVVELEEVEY